MNIKLLTRLLKRIDIPTFVFLSAWKEWIIDTFKEMALIVHQWLKYFKKDRSGNVSNRLGNGSA